MVVFNVFEPPSRAGDVLDRAERLVFVRDGFHWWAAIIPALWLLVKGLWLELIAFLVGAGALAWLLEALGMTPGIETMVFVIIQIVIGFEASQIYASALKRRGWREAGTVTGRDLEECERRFLDDWLAQQPEPGAPINGDGAAPGGGPGSEAGSDEARQGARPWTQVALDNARQALHQGRQRFSFGSGAKFEVKA